MQQIMNAIALGVLATAFMDVWALIQQRWFGIHPLDYRLLGRWLLGLRQGRFFHRTIAQSQPQTGERSLGWAAHYAIGIVFAAALLRLSTPGLPAALLTGWLTMVAPFFLMQPAFGFGVAASKTPHPAIARRNTLLAHTAFGLGLYLGGKLLSL